MNPLENWTEADLQSFVTAKVQESLVLDYKASAALTNKDVRKELPKDCSAFANSAGGRLIYGVVEEDHFPVRIDEGVDSSISKEWIEQIINSNIQPRISGIVIKPIVLSGGGFAYVIDIPQATAHAPHQASDNKYYKRFNFQSVPMEDYEVRDTLRRSTTPNLSINWSEPVSVNRHQLQCIVAIELRNSSPEPAQYGNIRVLFDQRLHPHKMSGRWTEEEGSFNGIPIILFNRLLDPKVDIPIYREEAVDFGQFRLEPEMRTSRFTLGSQITCPGFSSESEWVFISKGGDLRIEQK